MASEDQEHRPRLSVVKRTRRGRRAGGRSFFALRDNNEETKMRLLGKTAIVLGMAGAMALGSLTASEARGGRNAAIAGGLVAGAAIGAAAANVNAGYYGYGGYDSYAYEPAYAAPAPVYTSPSYYGPVTGGYESYNYNSGYDTNYIGPWRERKLMGLD